MGRLPVQHPLPHLACLAVHEALESPRRPLPRAVLPSSAASSSHLNCGQQAQILDTKEYLAPILMPHEAVQAFTPNAAWSPAWPAHFSSILQGALKPTSRGLPVSLAGQLGGPRPCQAAEDKLQVLSTCTPVRCRGPAEHGT